VSPSESTITSDSMAKYTISVTNTGNVKGNYTLSVINDTNVQFILEKSELLLSPGEIGDVQLTLEADVGSYLTYIEAVSKDDIFAYTKNKTLTLTVNPAPIFDFQIISPIVETTVYIGDSYHYTLEVINTGNMVDTYSFGMDYDIPSEFDKSNITLAPGEKVTRTVKVTSQNEGIYSTKIAVTSLISAETKSISYYTTSAEKAKIFITPKSRTVHLGKKSTFKLHVINNADQTQTFKLTTTTDMSDVTLSEDTLTIEPGSKSENVNLIVEPELGLKYITLRAESIDNAMINASVTVRVAGTSEPIYGVQVIAEENEKTVASGNNATFMVKVYNIGNTNDSYKLSSKNNNIIGTIPIEIGVIKPQSYETIMVSLNATSDEDAWFDITATANSGNNAKVYDTQRLIVKSVDKGQSSTVSGSDLEDTVFNLYNINDSIIKKSSIFYSNITESKLQNCYVDNTTLENVVSKNSKFYNSEVIDSYVIASRLTNAYVVNSKLKRVEIGSTVVDGKLIEGNLTVSGVRIAAEVGNPMDVVDVVDGLTEMDKNIVGIKNDSFTIDDYENTMSKLIFNVNESFVGASLKLLRTNRPPVGAPNNTSHTGDYLTIKDTRIMDNVNDAVLKIYYNDADFTEKEEQNLKMIYYNEDTKRWENLSSEVNTVDNYVWNTTNHFSTFALMSVAVAETPVDPVDPDNTPSSGGGGGGGGGGSTEPSANIEINQVEYIQKVTKGNTTDFAFKESKTPVVGVSFYTLMTPTGEVEVRVQQLYNRSVATMADLPGTVYKHLNIICSLSSPKEINNVKIKFKVSNNWMSENGVTSSDIVLYRWHDNKWNVLPTQKTESDGAYTHFSSDSPGFSPFGISTIPKNGIKDEIFESDEMMQDALTSQAVPTDETTFNTDEPDVSKGSGSTAALVLLSMVGLGIAGVAWNRRKG
ncbi:MAG: PGF-pre-PGF domain-containing protein, partial [Methanosarcinales archaeon]|nr:PGF-pre-PGF domain-containing protein [Methanosarcinales archaeon]